MIRLILEGVKLTHVQKSNDKAVSVLDLHLELRQEVIHLKQEVIPRITSCLRFLTFEAIGSLMSINYNYPAKNLDVF